MEIACNLTNLALDFTKFSVVHIFKAKPKCIMDKSSCKILIYVLVLNFKAMFLTPVRVTQERFLYSFGQKTAKLLH